MFNAAAKSRNAWLTGAKTVNLRFPFKASTKPANCNAATRYVKFVSLATISTIVGRLPGFFSNDPLPFEDTGSVTTLSEQPINYNENNETTN